MPRRTKRSSATTVVRPIMAYQWREGSAYHDRADAQEVGEAIDQLANSKGGRPLTPDEIVAAAEDPRSPLHELFEWDNRKAAYNWRKSQARDITGALVIVSTLPSGTKVRDSRAYVSVEKQDDEKRGYVHVSRAVGYDIEEKARQELDAWCRRYAGVQLLAPLVQSVYSILGRRRRVARTA